MALLDPKRRSITLKFVYYGPSGVGKTQSLRLLLRRLREGMSAHGEGSAPAGMGAGGRPGSLLSLDSDRDRTLFFEALSLESTVPAEQDQCGRLLLRLFAVPGEIIHRHTRRLLLRGADGVVLVSGAGPASSEKAEPSMLAELRSNLHACGLREGNELDAVPIMTQASPQGPLADAMVIETLLSLLQAAWPAAQRAAVAASLQMPELAPFLADLQRRLLVCTPSSKEPAVAQKLAKAPRAVAAVTPLRAMDARPAREPAKAPWASLPAPVRARVTT
jgi:hypothetical protein